MWENTYKNHLLKIEKVFQEYNPPFKNDVKIYIAGFIAKHLDNDYLQQIQNYIIGDEELDALIRKHLLKLGQNSIVYFFAKINAEYQMFKIIKNKIYEPNIYFYSLKQELKEPAKLFLITSNYSKLCGKIYLSLIYEIIYKRIIEIFSILFSYFHGEGIKEFILEMGKNNTKSKIDDSIRINENDIQFFLNNFEPKNDLKFPEDSLPLRNFSRNLNLEN